MAAGMHMKKPELNERAKRGQRLSRLDRVLENTNDSKSKDR